MAREDVARAKPPSPGDRATEILARLERAIPEARTELDFATPWQLVVATILSAQSTDRVINRVTPELFRRWPTPADLAAAAGAEVEEVVKTTGFFRNKAKAIRAAAALLTERHGGEVPRTIAELIELPGVARKTANVVLGAAYGVSEGIIVDTHVGRVARRLELTHEEDPSKVEAELSAQIPRSGWIGAGLRIVLHGRYVCTARKPSCATCPLNELCPSREADPLGPWTDRADQEHTLTDSKRETA